MFTFRSAFRWFTRFLCLVYAIAACIAFPEARQLLRSDAYLEDDTLYIPLILCEPNSIEQDGTKITYDASDIAGCTTLDFLVNAAACSLVLSAAAILLYLLVEILYDFGKLCNRRWLKKTTILGMGLFLIFILIQAAVSSWALAAETQFWVNVHDSFYDKLNYYEMYDFDEVKAHGKIGWLWVTGAVAIITAAFILGDLVLQHCWRTNQGEPQLSTTQTDRSVGEAAAEGVPRLEMVETTTANENEPWANPF